MDRGSNCYGEQCPNGVCKVHTQRQITTPECVVGNFCCPKRCESHQLEWRRMSEQLERKLLALGWGCT